MSWQKGSHLSNGSANGAIRSLPSALPDEQEGRGWIVSHCMPSKSTDCAGNYPLDYRLTTLLIRQGRRATGLPFWYLHADGDIRATRGSLLPDA